MYPQQALISGPQHRIQNSSLDQEIGGNQPSSELPYLSKKDKS
ncbi:unnamed protein product [Penicillium camemberti]|uniref:Str. FM013 n=1 Tax=Penicillium camemberti (strain FM 013) TaxID=1429867 RepID=A0A0G4PVQ7_PENC3|nr:unnamed protein product [Penicillium camemberti]